MKRIVFTLILWTVLLPNILVCQQVDYNWNKYSLWVSNLIVGKYGSTNRGILQMIGGGTSDEGTVRYFSVLQAPGTYLKPDQNMRVLADNTVSIARSTKVTGEFEATGVSTFGSLVADSIELDNGTATGLILFGLDNVMQFYRPINIEMEGTRTFISTNGIWMSNSIHTGAVRLSNSGLAISLDEVPVIHVNTNNSISVSNSVMADFFVGQYYGNGLTVTNIPGSNIFGQITDALTRSNDWLGTFTGNTGIFTNLTAGTASVDTYNVNTLNATNFWIMPNAPPAAATVTNGMYFWNSNGQRAYILTTTLDTTTWAATNALW